MHECPLGRIVDIFPNETVGIRLVSAILAEQHDGWQVGRCSFNTESLVAAISNEPMPERVSPTAGE